MGGLQRPPPDLLLSGRYPMATDIATRYGDLDLNGHVNNVAMAAIFQEARAWFFSALGLHWPPGGQRPMVASVQIDYLAEAFHPAPIRMNIGVSEIGRSSWTVAALAVQGSRACALCRAALVCTEDRRPAAMEAHLREAFESRRLLPA